MKNGKATGPDNLPIEVWKSLGRTGVNSLKEALSKITDEEEKIPDMWRNSFLTPIYNNKGDIMNCLKCLKQRRSQDFCLGGGTRPMPPSLASVVHTFEAVAGSWRSVSTPAVGRVMSGAPERKK